MVDILQPEQRNVLLKRLVGLTEAGKLKWEEGFGDTFTSIAGSHVFTVGARDNDGVAPYYLSVTSDDSFQALVRIETNVDAWSLEEDDSNELLKALYTAAARRALDLNAVVEKLFGDLDRLDREPPF